MNAPFGWPGGNRYLLKMLLKLIPPHKAYVEVFSGSAKLLFAKAASTEEDAVDSHPLRFYIRDATPSTQWVMGLNQKDPLPPNEPR